MFSVVMKDVMFVLVGTEPVLVDAFCVCWLVFVFLFRLAHLWRGTTSFRVYLPSGPGHLFFSPIWSSLAFVIFSGCLCPFFFFPPLFHLFFFFVVRFFSLFNVSGLMACVCACLSY